MTGHTASSQSEQQLVKLQRLRNVLLIWLDRSADDGTEDCRNTATQLQSTIGDVAFYTDAEQCMQVIATNTDNKVCLVISESLGQHVMPRIHDMTQVDTIFIYCGNKEHHEEWTKEWPKIRGVFTEIIPICNALQQAAGLCEHNATPISFVPSDTTVDQLDSSFMYAQMLKETLLTIDFTDQHFQEYIDYCRQAFGDNPAESVHVEKLERDHRRETAIWWYSYECFFRRMLNRALRTMDGDIITRMSFFINDLQRHIQREHRKHFIESSSTPFTAYRGQGLSKTDFAQLMDTKGGLISFNCFLSTSNNHDVSLDFAVRAKSNPDLVGILFEMVIDPNQSTTTPFVSIAELRSVKNEEGLLFTMHSVFRINAISMVDEASRLYKVHLSLTTDDDPQLRELSDHIRNKTTADEDGWCRLAFILTEMGQFEKAEAICKNLLSTKPDKSSHSSIYHRLGLIKYQQEKFEEALEFTEKALTIRQDSLPTAHPDLAESYSSVGLLYDSMGDYSKALSHFQKALAIRQESLPASHPNVTICYNNIGLTYNGMDNYPKALSYFEKALAVWEESLPATHPDLAGGYNNIGSVHSSMGDYLKALSYHEKALAIRQKSLSATHPDLANSYNNIGSVYNTMGDYSKAIRHFEKALAIWQTSLPATHSDLATSYSNIGLVYNSMGDYPKALTYSEKALAIRQESLPAAHPDLGISYNNIGLVYYSMEDYAKALSYYTRKPLRSGKNRFLSRILTWPTLSTTSAVFTKAWLTIRRHCHFLKKRRPYVKGHFLAPIPI